MRDTCKEPAHSDPAQLVLAALRRHYGDRYTIHHNDDLWVAADRSPSGLTAPTIIEPTLELFVAALESPGRRVGAPFSPESRTPSSRSFDLGDVADLTLGEGKNVQEGKRQIYC